MFAKVFGLLCQVATAVVLARVLGPRGYGIYSFPMAIVALLSVPATAGFSELGTRSIAQYDTTKDFRLMRGFLLRSHQIVAILSVVLAILAGVVYSVTNTGGSSAEAQTFYLALLMLPLLALINVPSAIMRGLGSVVLGVAPHLVLRPALFLVLIGLFIAIGTGGLSSVSAIGLQVTASSIALVVTFIWLRRALPSGVRGLRAEYRTRAWLRSALPFTLSSTMFIVLQQTDIVMLGLLRPAEDVGIYRAATQGAMLVGFVLNGVNMAIAPTIARHWAVGEARELQAVIRRSARWIAVGTVSVAAILLLGGSVFLDRLFGPAFLYGTSSLRILCLAQLFCGLAGPVGSVMNMTGSEDKMVLGAGIAIAVNVTANAVLVPMIGIDGAAIATAASLTTWIVLLVYWVRRATGLRVTTFSWV